ncbi:MAG: hypothetical protein KC776_03920 [Myxococcales bacterium]|nr:hypothetical protein [Myxococcales bacterium]MCB9580143.1 hypothetical protein [Polyangiaceae bacterium]
MRLALLLSSVVVLSLTACHRQEKKGSSFADTFADPAPPGQEEKWEAPEPEEAAPAPEPPPPPTPTSPPPTTALGFTFGATKADTMRACTKKGTWSRSGESYSCSRAPDGSLSGKPLLAFCGDALCAIGIAVTPKENDWNTWNTQYTALKQSLVEKHGAPTTATDDVAAECQNEEFVTCLKDGKANAEAIWLWKEGHRVSIRMSQKQSSDGPPAIRFVSMVEASE